MQYICAVLVQSADEAMVKGGEREREIKERSTEKITAAKIQFPPEMELSQRPREGNLALTAAERRRNEAILAER